MNTRKNWRAIPLSSVVVAAVSAAALVAGLGVTAREGSAAPPAGPIERVGSVTLPANAAVTGPAEVIVDAADNRLFVECTGPNCFDPHRNTSLDFTVFDLRSRQLLGQINTPYEGDYGYALDQAHHRLFQMTIAQSALAALVIDTRTLKMTELLAMPGTTDGQGSEGIVYSPGDDLLYLAAVPPGLPLQVTNNPGLDIYAVSPKDGRVVWQQATSCSAPYAPFNAPYLLGLGRDGRNLYTACANAFERMPVHPGSDGQRHDATYPGITQGSFTNGIFVPGLDRLVLLTFESGSGGGASALAYVFDGPSGNYIAAPTLFSAGNGNTSYQQAAIAVDPVTGRLYSQDYAFANTGGCNPPVSGTDQFAIVETSLPENAAINLPTSDPSLFAKGALIAVDPADHELYVFNEHLTYPGGCHGDDGQPGTPTVDIFRDNIPPARPPGAVNPDAGTTNIPEAAGKTSANFTARASAIGVRLLHAPTDPKEVTWAHIRSSTVGKSEVTATADGLDVPADSQDTLVQQAGSGYSPGSCQDNGDGRPESKAAQPSGSASVSCDFAKLSSSGDASSANIASSSVDPASPDQQSLASGQQNAFTGAADPPVTVSGVTVHTAAARSASDGSQATATVAVTSIAVGGVLQADQLTVQGSARAHGVPGSAVAKYRCTVTNLRIYQTLLVGTRDCQDPGVQAAVSAANASSQSQQLGLLIAFPSPYDKASSAPLGDSGLVLQQSPGGFIARAQASNLEQNYDLIFTGVRANEQMGLVVTYIRDTSSRHVRYIADFGGISVSATYGIYPLGQFSDLGPQGDAGVAAGLTPPLTPPLDTLGTTPPSNAQPSVVTPPATTGSSAGLQSVLEDVIDGARLLWQNPRLIPPLLAVWALLVLPAYLLSRRRSLLSAIEVAQ